MANFADPQENTNARKIVLATGNATDPAISSAKDLTKGIYFDSVGNPVLTGTGSGVSSIHADANPNISGAVHLVSGANVTLTQVGQDITIASSGGSGTPNVVTFTDNAETDTTGTVYVPATSTVTITASSNTAQIKITASGLGQNDNNGAPNNRSFWTIFKDGVTDLSGGSSLAGFSCQSANGTSLVPIVMSVLDTPGDTNPHTYTVYFKSSQAGQDTSWGSALQLSIITAEEIH